MKHQNMRCQAHGEGEPVGDSSRHTNSLARCGTIGVRIAFAASVGAAALVLAGCATPPPPPPEPAPAVVSLEEWLARGDAARKDALHEAARSAYREAAKAYPTDKQPWLRLADDYFGTADYGNAVLAAQEAIQRDPRDNTAHSVLAVSGLRITAGSLAALREQSGYPVGSREEALEVTRRLREALSDPSLLPPAPPEPPQAPARKPRLVRPSGAPAPAAPARSAGAKPGPARGSNPLDKLK